MNHQMPKFDIAAMGLSDADRAIAEKIVSTRGENKGRLRASAPAVAVVGKAKNRWGSAINVYDQTDAAGYYVWRMVAFQVSPVSQHQCMPVTDDLYLSGDMDERRARAKELDRLIDAIVNTVPKAQWHGINRWGRALGYL